MLKKNYILNICLLHFVTLLINITLIKFSSIRKTREFKLVHNFKYTIFISIAFIKIPINCKCTIAI